MAFLRARVSVGQAARHHLVGDPAEPVGDLDPDVALVLLEAQPVSGRRPEMVVAADQVVRDLDQGTPQGTVAADGQRTVGVIDPVALVSPGIEPARPVIWRAPA